MLRTWRAEVSKKFSQWLVITCPHCDNQAMVKRVTWMRSHSYRTRSCPYCFKTSNLPE